MNTIDSATKDLTLRFVDTHHGKWRVHLNRDVFANACSNQGYHVFTEIIDNLSKTMRRGTTIRVPYVSAMKDIIQFVLNGTFKRSDDPEKLCAIEIIRRVYCMDHFRMDSTDEFAKLLHCDIDHDAYELVHRFVREKCYGHKLYIKFLATKLPDVYDMGTYPPRILQKMRKILMTNFVIMYGPSTLRIYDTTQCTVSTDLFDTEEKLRRYRDFGHGQNMVVVNPVKPIVAVADSEKGAWKKMILYHLFEQRVVVEFGMNNLGSIHSMCFSSDGKFLYISATKPNHQSFITMYDVDNNKFVSEYNLDSKATMMTLSPDGKLLAFVDTSNSIHCVDFESSTDCVIYKGVINNIAFVDNSTLAFCIHNKIGKPIALYNHEDSRTTIIEGSEINTRASSITRTIVPNPHTRTFICYTRADPKIDDIVAECFDTEPDTMIFHNGRVISETFTRNEGFTIRGMANCFASNGKYIYSSMANDTSGMIQSYVLCATGEIIPKEIISFSPNKRAYTHNKIISVCYDNHDLMTKIAHLM